MFKDTKQHTEKKTKTKTKWTKGRGQLHKRCKQKQTSGEDSKKENASSVSCNNVLVRTLWMLLYLLWFFVLFSRAKLEPAKNCKTVWLLLRHSFIWVYMCIVLVASLAYVTALWKQENFRPFLISSFQYLSQTSFRTVRSQNTFIHTFTFRHSHVNKTKQTHTYIHTWFRNRKYL